MPEPTKPPCAAPALMRRWRESKGITGKAAAKLAGVSQPAWSDWEAGKRIPRVDMAVRIADLTRGAVPVTAWVPRGGRLRRAA